MTDEIRPFRIEIPQADLDEQPDLLVGDIRSFFHEAR